MAATVCKTTKVKLLQEEAVYFRLTKLRAHTGTVCYVNVANLQYLCKQP